MSKDETITIEVPVEWVEFKGNNSNGQIPKHKEMVQICREALDARKSKYDSWLEGVLKGWENIAGNLTRDNYMSVDVKLMAAAPEMLDALVEIYRQGVSNGITKDIMFDSLIEAIRAALPEDIADEVLGS